ncbi:MAG: radical SAM protein [Thermoleophilia bacterium]
MPKYSDKLREYRSWYHFLKRSEFVPAVPQYVNIEPTSACNLKCTVCSLDGSRKRGTMDMGLFRSIVDQSAAIGVPRIALFLAGEPLLHKELPQMVEYISSKGISARIRTNGALLTPEKSEALLDAGLDFLGFSFDGDNKADYESIRVGADYDQVLENILHFLELKQQKKLEKPFVSLRMIKLADNPRQQIDPAFRERFAGLPINEIIATNPHSWRGEVEGITERDYGQYDYPCAGLWTALSIAWDGKVICCTDLNGQQVFGDVSRQTLMEAWNSDTMRYHRRMQKEGRFAELPLCAGCHGFQYDYHPKWYIISHLPPLEQAKAAARFLLRRGKKQESFPD